MDTFEITKRILISCLQLDGPAADLSPSTPLAGAMPELNSLTITTIITAIEEQLDCEIDDDELTMELFETVGSLQAFIESKL